MKSYRKVEAQRHSFLVPDDVSRQLCAPTTLTPGKAPLSYLTEGWMGPTAALDVLEKIYPIASKLRGIFFHFPPPPKVKITVRPNSEVLYSILRKSRKTSSILDEKVALLTEQ
jgi:hypothetical protein